MTTILPPRELAVIRAVAKSAAVLFVWMSIERLYPDRPVSELEFADMLGVDVRTVQRQLRGLSSAGLAMCQRGGFWLLTPNGKNTLFAEPAQNVLNSPQILQPSHDGMTIEASEVQVAGPAQNVLHESHFVLHDDDESIHSELKDSSSSINERTFCATTKEILQHTNILFGTSVSINRTMESRNAEHALCWISKAWQDRQRLSNPAGLVYKRMMENQIPPVYLRKNPYQGLPGEYLEAIGYQQPVAAESFEEDAVELSGEIIDEVMEVDDSAAAIAWRAVQNQLEGEMSRNNFERYVKDTQGVELCEGMLTVCTKCAEDCEWLESRLESSINRMLVGICASEVHVRFVSAGGE